MKNKFKTYFFTILFLTNLNFYLESKELNIFSKKVSVGNDKVVIFENDVVATDEKNNILYTDKAKYNKSEKKLDAIGNTKIITSEGYTITGNNILFDNENKIISSLSDAKIVDLNGNKIYVTMFNYMIDKNMFISKGEIKLLDIKNNEYYLSEIYIDEKKNKIVASDVRAFLNNNDAKYNKENEPRFFANSMLLTKEKNEFNKGVFTYCKNRTGDKCPPWVLKSKKINHDTSTKTIHYDSAVLKVYDFPIFYFPTFSHPDPTVKRRSGFLVPTFLGNSSTGYGTSTPYFWAISDDKDITFTPRVYASHHPLMLGEFRQDFEKSYLIVDAGYTKGFKEITKKKKKGSRSHFFSKFLTNFSNEDNITNELALSLQTVNHLTHLKLTDINTTLVDNNINVLDSSLSYSFENDDLFFGANISAYENLLDTSNSRYEYLLPYLTLEKNVILNEDYGNIDWISNLRVRNHGVNKQTEFFINDMNWTSNAWLNKFGIENQLQGLVKTVNYNAKNEILYKNDKDVSELSAGFGYLAKLGLYKNNLSSNTGSLLTPKLFLRYAPGHMNNDSENYSPLKASDLYRIKRSSEISLIEKGLSAAIGFDYKKLDSASNNSLNKEKISLSMGQIISEKENFDISRSSSLDQKVSDLVGATSYNINENVKLNYNFTIDHNYQEFNYSEINSEFSFGSTKFNVGYLEESKHVGNQEYIVSDFEISLSESGKFSVAQKRNLMTDSFEYYNFSYDYINDCLKAGLVFRREFYKDRDIEPGNSLMFRISIIPFANINAPLLGE